MRRFFKTHLSRLRHADSVAALEAAMGERLDPIPVFIVSFNNGVYVRNTVRQLKRFDLHPIVLDNASTDRPSLDILDDLSRSRDARIVRCGHNIGHRVGFTAVFYPYLPEVFAYTDPDLGFNPDLPSEFLEVLSGLTETFGVYKAGFALSLLEDEAVSDAKLELSRSRSPAINVRYSIQEWESRFWLKRLVHRDLEVYAAPIDTTFAVYRKANYRGDFLDSVRVGGSFAAIHLPWYPALDLLSSEDRKAYRRKNRSTTWVGR